MWSKIVCIVIVSPVILLVIAWIALVVFWSGGPGVYSSRDNAELLATHLRPVRMGPVPVSELAKGLQLTTHECLCVSESYSSPGAIFRVGDNDITSQFGAETFQEGFIAVMTVDPNRDGRVERALVRREGITVALPRFDDTAYHGIWCGPGEAGVDIEATGSRVKIMLREVSYPSSPCAVSTQ